MNIEEIKDVRCIRISGAKALDPITVTLEEWEEKRTDETRPNHVGKIIIECYGKAWATVWGSMGMPIIDFVLSCDEYYIAKKIAPNIDASVTDIEAINKAIDKFNDDPFSITIQNETNFNHIESEHQIPYCHAIPMIYENEWWDNLPTKRNHEYEYILRIIKATQSALKEIKDKECKTEQENAAAKHDKI